MKWKIRSELDDDKYSRIHCEASDGKVQLLGGKNALGADINFALYLSRDLQL